MCERERGIKDDCTLLEERDQSSREVATELDLKSNVSAQEGDRLNRRTVPMAMGMRERTSIRKDKLQEWLRAYALKLLNATVYQTYGKGHQKPRRVSETHLLGAQSPGTLRRHLPVK